MNLLKDSAAIFFAILSMAMSESAPGADNAAIRSATILKIQAELDGDSALNFPPFLKSYEPLLIGILVDGAIYAIGKTGVFKV